jgi:hypothetical protein
MAQLAFRTRGKCVLTSAWFHASTVQARSNIADLLSKAGNSRARSLLVEAAWALLRWKTPKSQALHEWATRIAVRRGKATAVVALARKLAGIMFAIWRDGTEFNPEHMTGRSSVGAVAVA